MCSTDDHLLFFHRPLFILLFIFLLFSIPFNCSIPNISLTLPDRLVSFPFFFFSRFSLYLKIPLPSPHFSPPSCSLSPTLPIPLLLSFLSLFLYHFLLFFLIYLSVLYFLLTPSSLFSDLYVLPFLYFPLFVVFSLTLLLFLSLSIPPPFPHPSVSFLLSSTPHFYTLSVLCIFSFIISLSIFKFSPPLYFPFIFLLSLFFFTSLSSSLHSPCLSLTLSFSSLFFSTSITSPLPYPPP